MNVLSNLQRTLNAIFDFYRTSGKQYAGFSLKFACISVLSGIAVSLLAAVISESFTPAYYRQMDLGDYFYYVYYYGSTVMIFNCALYGVFLFKNAGSLTAPSFSSFFTAIDRKTWTAYAVFSLASIAVFLLIRFMMIALFPLPQNSSPLAQLFGNNPTAGAMYFSMFIGFIQKFIPYILVFFMLKSSIGKQFPSLNGKWFRNVFFTLLILGFGLNLFTAEVASDVQLMVGMLLSFIVHDSPVQVIFTVAIYILVLTVFLPFISGALVFPFTHREETPANRAGRPDDSSSEQQL